MKRLCLLLFIAFIFSYSFAQNDQENNGRYFIISANDSVYLDIYDNPDTSMITRMIKEEKKDLLVICNGLVNVGYMDWLQAKYLKNRKIRELLQTFKIIRLFVVKRNANPKDLYSIGVENMWYQHNRFRTASQPYFVISRMGKPMCHSSDVSSQEDFIKFLEGCKKK